MSNTGKDTSPGKRLLIIAAFIIVWILGTACVIYLTGWLQAGHRARQEQIHSQGAHIMPFALNKTLHVFRMTESGGIQQVVARDPNDSTQIALIRRHLQHEASRFAVGDYSDPIALHGSDMPGVHTLAAHAGQIRISYAELPNGAQMTFTTHDLALITAVHRWFGAQLSDHGRDATSR